MELIYDIIFSYKRREKKKRTIKNWRIFHRIEINLREKALFNIFYEKQGIFGISNNSEMMPLDMIIKRNV